jgi:coenzyme F420-reducing hydrogenase alpha subunit
MTETGRRIPLNVSVRPLSRIEGHANITIRISQGKVKEARWEVVETPRFFEAMLAGKLWENAPYLSGRICGICSISHTLASIRAVENAFGIIPGQQTEKLRLLLKHMETLQSHVLHLYFLAAPDFLGEGSVLPLAESHPQEVQRALRLKLLANDACDIIGGRRLHPTRTVVGGFTMLPTAKELRLLRQRLVAALPDIYGAAELFRNFTVPDFTRETEFVSLSGEGSYPFIGGRLVSSDGVCKAESEYRAMTNEYCITGSTSKWARLSRDSFAVGPLARVNNNYAALQPAAQAAAAELGINPLCHNPFKAHGARLVECIHVAQDSLRIVDELLASDSEVPRLPVSPRMGRGVGAVEAPRGILYHCYEFDCAGRIVKADCVIPTGQNHGNIQLDIEALANHFAEDGTGDREIELLASMLVRAYDPCVSCSVH